MHMEAIKPIKILGGINDSSYPLGSLPRVFYAAGSHESPVPAVVWGPRRSFDHQHVRPGSGCLHEDEHNVTLKIEVTGIDEKDIDVRIENNTLTVHGERNFEKEEKEENYRRIERQYGSFTRSFTLPSTVDPNNVQANYEKGVLKIKLAKKAEAKPKQIKVNVAGERTLEGKGAGKAA